jgi:hypothetical protein
MVLKVKKFRFFNFEIKCGTFFAIAGDCRMSRSQTPARFVCPVQKPKSLPRVRTGCVMLA